MRFWFIWLLTLAAGIGVAFVFGWLIGLLWPLGGRVVFYSLSAVWVLIALTYRQRSAAVHSDSLMRTAKFIVSFVLVLGAVYALSFAADMLMGRAFGVYPGTIWVPVVIWPVIAAIFTSLGALLSRAKVAMVGPWLVIGCVALVGDIFGNHIHSYAVAGLVLLVAAWRFWVAAHHQHAPAS